MTKRIKQIFLFLIPTLIVAVVFILLNQQNIFITADSDSDSSTAKIELPDSSAKHLSIDNHLFTFHSPNIENGLTSLTTSGNASNYNFSLNCNYKSLIIKNRSPPANIFSLNII